MDMEPGIINVKQEVPGVGTMNQKVGFVSMLLSATGMGLVGTFGRLSTPVDPTTGSKYIIGDFLATGRAVGISKSESLSDCGDSKIDHMGDSWFGICCVGVFPLAEDERAD